MTRRQVLDDSEEWNDSSDSSTNSDTTEDTPIIPEGNEIKTFVQNCLSFPDEQSIGFKIPKETAVKILSECKKGSDVLTYILDQLQDQNKEEDMNLDSVE